MASELTHQMHLEEWPAPALYCLHLKTATDNFCFTIHQGLSVLSLLPFFVGSELTAAAGATLKKYYRAGLFLQFFFSPLAHSRGSESTL